MTAPPVAPSAATLSTFTVGPAEAVGGGTATGKVTLSAPAPAAGAVILLSDTVASAEAPPSVTVPAGLTTKSFIIKTTAVAIAQSGIVKATFAGITKTAPLTVRPIGVQTVKFANSTVFGGNNAVCTVVLERPAAPGGIRAVISSSNTGVATPTVSTILFATGSRSQSFGVRTSPTTLTKSANIVAIANGVSKNGKLTVVPANTACSYSITPTSKQFTSAGGTGAVNVTAGANCSWTAIKNNNVTWINITGSNSGSGNGLVNYTVAANTGNTSRAGSLTIAGKTFNITQAAASSCAYSISPISKQFTGAGGTGSVNVTAGNGCSWTATKNNNPTWVTITSGSSGSGNGVVNYSVAASDATRTATLTIAGKTFTITQEATDDEEEPSPALVTLQGASLTAFNPLDSTVKFIITNATLTPDANRVTIFRNKVFVDKVNIQVVGNTITLSLPLASGLNDLELITEDNQGRSIFQQFALWAGDHTLNLSILDQNSQPISGANVTALLNDDQAVVGSAVSSNGQVAFHNLPDRTIIINAKASGNRFATTALTGVAGSAQLTLKGFDPASTVVNNDFSLGIAGWNTGTAPVQIISHVEGSGLVASPTVDNDLVVSTASGVEGTQSISRTFKINPGTKNVTVRFRFITSEVPGGYCGTKYNDYYSVTVRSQSGSGAIAENQSMNGIGCNAFDSAGGIAWRQVSLPVGTGQGTVQENTTVADPHAGQITWREFSLPVSADGDTVQADITVANVGDGLYQSQVVLDVVQEKKLTINNAQLRDVDNSQLEYLSTDAHTYYTSNTRVHGTISISGAEDDSLTSVKLNVIEGGVRVAKADLSVSAKSKLLNKPFGEAGKIEITASQLLFELPSAQAALVNRATVGEVSLEIEAESQNGESVKKSVGSVWKLVNFKGSSRYGDRDPRGCTDKYGKETSYPCGGDDWVSPGVDKIATYFMGKGIMWGDFSNMNGGNFPPHHLHQTGHSIDGKFDGYKARDAATAHKMLEYLNDPVHGSKITKVFVAYKKIDSDAFWNVIRHEMVHGRPAEETIIIESSHTTHFHWEIDD